MTVFGWEFWGPWLRWNRCWEHDFCFKVIFNRGHSAKIRIIVWRLMFTVGADKNKKGEQ